MASIWEAFIDFTLILMKLVALFFLVRLLLMAFGLTFEVPVVDQYLWRAMQEIFESSPRVPGLE